LYKCFGALVYMFLEDMEENEIDSFVRNLVKTIKEYAHAGFSYLQT